MDNKMFIHYGLDRSNYECILLENKGCSREEASTLNQMIITERQKRFGYEPPREKVEFKFKSIYTKKVSWLNKIKKELYFEVEMWLARDRSGRDTIEYKATIIIVK